MNKSIMYKRLLCSTCSNPASPEFREFIHKGDTLTCTVCGRTLRIIRPLEYTKDDWTFKMIHRNSEKIDKNDYVFEVIHEGRS